MINKTVLQIQNYKVKLFDLLQYDSPIRYIFFTSSFFLLPTFGGSLVLYMGIKIPTSRGWLDKSNYPLLIIMGLVILALFAIVVLYNEPFCQYIFLKI